MKPGGGKQKGSAFERVVCRDLSLWMTGGKRDDLFWRSAMSGGRATVKFKKGGENLTQTGDITAIDPLGEMFTRRFIPECKFYSNLDFRGALLGNKGGISGFWLELVEKAKQQGNKLPIMFAKENRTSPVVVLDDEGAKLLDVTRLIQVRLAVGTPMLILWYEKFMQFAKPPLDKASASEVRAVERKILSRSCRACDGAGYVGEPQHGHAVRCEPCGGTGKA